jgi:hypothetical protein
MIEQNQTSGYVRIADVLDQTVRALEPNPAMQDRLGRLSVELEQLRATSESQAGAVGENTSAVLENTVAHATQGGGSILAEAGRSALSVFASGLGLSPIFSGLAHLFGGDSKVESPAPLVPYVRPAPVQFDGTAGVKLPQEPADDQGGWAGFDAGANPKSGANITIQIQAMDARSFIDRGDEIARAVRLAMLNSHALNDVVSEL